MTLTYKGRTGHSEQSNQVTKMKFLSNLYQRNGQLILKKKCHKFKKEFRIMKCSLNSKILIMRMKKIVMYLMINMKRRNVVIKALKIGQVTSKLTRSSSIPYLQ